MLLQAVRKAVLDLTVELIATSSAFIGNCLQVWAVRTCVQVPSKQGSTVVLQDCQLLLYLPQDHSLQ
jgi:hypothetical protein